MNTVRLKCKFDALPFDAGVGAVLLVGVEDDATALEIGIGFDAFSGGAEHCAIRTYTCGGAVLREGGSVCCCAIRYGDQEQEH